MTTHHVLIDYENVQPKDVAALKGHPVRVVLFVGANQTKVSFELASALQPLGDRAEYVHIGGTGRNALDFHLAFHLGQLAERNPGDVFHIVSKDTGFDPLVRSMRSSGLKVTRSNDLGEISFETPAVEKSDDEKIATIVRDLSRRGPAAPRRVKTLTSTVHALFAKKLPEGEVSRLVELLRERGHVIVDGSKVTYTLPQTGG